MRVIPVIDILNKVAVNAVRGKRKEYKPLKSILSKSIEPLEVAKNFRSLGFCELYVADLDAIMSCSTNFQIFNTISKETGVKLMVDAGVSNIKRARKLLASRVSKLVIGTETLLNKGFVEEALSVFDCEQVIVSLDLKSGKVLTKLASDGYDEPLCLLQDFKDMGVSQVIVMDLERVGSSEGVNIDFLEQVIGIGVEVYVGGGIRHLDDLDELDNLGVSGILVATALHTGKISVGDLINKGYL